MSAPVHQAVNQPATQVSRALQPFGTTIFTTMTRLAVEHGAVNLAQGFPDFDGPMEIREAAADALRGAEGRHNQYAPMPGLPALRQTLAARRERDTGLSTDPDTDVVITAGCTEAIAAAIMGLCNPGDALVMFEPFYDSYRACAAMAGVQARAVALRPALSARPDGGETPAFTFDPDELRAAIAPANAPRARAILLNTPHNPTGKVFSPEELALVADLCIRHDLIAVTDEVYERLVFGHRRHVSLASLPGMRDRTVTLSSLGKTFSLTGWKIGWAIASPPLAAAVRSAHQFLTFAVATPLQWGAVEALRREAECVPPLVATLDQGRGLLARALADVGLLVHQPEGAYFILADHSAVSTRLGLDGSDVAFCDHLIKRVGVAAIPPSVFYERPQLGRSLVRFAFCKRHETLGEAISRLAQLRA
ncbi:MAG: aminotransferase class I/II-fold pyridoxal phosphate-dependent enzyme [Phycisphaerales bacterium]